MFCTHVGVEGIEPRASSLEYKYLRNRVCWNALMQTAIAVYTAF